MPAFSYRSDAAVPPFPDDRPVFIFDGVCVLCSSGARWLMRHDRRQRFRYATAQSGTGAALYRHYGVELDATYLLLSEGLAYGKSDGYLQMCQLLGGWWRLLLVLGLLPRSWRDWAYDVLARNRYRWFGKVEYCQLLPASLRQSLLP